jgi:hypothetical protein
MRLNSRHPRTVFTSKSLLQARNPPFLHMTAGLYSIAEVGSFRHPPQTCFQSEQSQSRSFSSRAISSS